MSNKDNEDMDRLVRLGETTFDDLGIIVDGCDDIATVGTEHLNDVDENNGKMFLTEKELLEINLRSEKTKVFENNKDISNIKGHLIDAQIQSLKNKIESLEKDKVILGFHALMDNTKQETFRDDTKSLLKSISMLHDIDPTKKWGFNPETGEIVID